MSWALPLTEIEISEEDVEAVMECLRSGWLTMGPRTEAFEADFANYIGAEHAIAVSSGTAALHLSMLAAGIGPGDEVIVPALSFVATAAAVRYTGATPVLCDIVGPERLQPRCRRGPPCTSRHVRARWLPSICWGIPPRWRHFERSVPTTAFS